MKSDPVVAYVAVPSENAASAGEVLHELTPRLGLVDAIHLCRRAPSHPGRMIPHAPSAVGGTILSETWLASADWVTRDLHAEPSDVGRIVVAVDWPVSPAIETTLLLNRLNTGAIRLAVRVTSSDAERIFLYFNRLGFPWFALPDGDVDDTGWASVIATLGRLWCLDARGRTPVEPIQTLFTQLLAELLDRTAPAWRYIAVDAGHSTVTPHASWSPSIHAALVADPDRASPTRLQSLAQADHAWMDEFRARHGGRLRELLTADAVTGVTR